MNVITRLSPAVDAASRSPQAGPCCIAGDQARGLLKALADPIRLRVVETLASGERCVCELTAELGLPQSKLSFHLKVLKDAGLLADRQQGRWIYYRLQPGAIVDLRGWLDQLLSCCQASGETMA